MRKKIEPSNNPFYQRASARLVRRGFAGGQHRAPQGTSTADDRAAHLRAFGNLDGREVDGRSGGRPTTQRLGSGRKHGSGPRCPKPARPDVLLRAMDE